jgi:hypothetical protein
MDLFNDGRLIRFAGLASTILLDPPLFSSPAGGEGCGIILDRRLPFSFRNGPTFDRRLPLPPFGTPDPNNPAFGIEDPRFVGVP